MPWTSYFIIFLFFFLMNFGYHWYSLKHFPCSSKTEWTLCSQLSIIPLWKSILCYLCMGCLGYVLTRLGCGDLCLHTMWKLDFGPGGCIDWSRGVQEHLSHPWLRAAGCLHHRALSFHVFLAVGSSKMSYFFTIRSQPGLPEHYLYLL